VSPFALRKAIAHDLTEQFCPRHCVANCGCAESPHIGQECIRANMSAVSGTRHEYQFNGKGADY
jgi:hypothetical protein